MSNPAVPVHLRKLRGNPSKTPMPKDLPAPPPDTLDAPEWLGPEARNAWIELAPTMARLKLLTALDVVAFSAFCATWAAWKEARAKADTAGVILTGASETTKPDGTIVRNHGRPRINPYVYIANQQAILLMRFCREFGLTPSARASLGIRGFGGADNLLPEMEDADAWIERRRAIG